jgi:diacylglycerol kinase family enzyme
VRRLLLVVNPAASGFTASLVTEILEILGGEFEASALWPQGPEEAQHMAAEAAAAGADVVAAMGGDGIAHRVANGVFGTATALGLIPAGTTNVLAGVLRLPGEPRRAAAALASGRVRPLRCAVLGGRVVLFSAGMGLDADVVRVAERDPLRKVGFGALHYARSVAGVVFGDYRHRHPTLRVTAGDRSSDAVGVLIQIHDRYTDVAGVPMRLTTEIGAGLTALVMHRVSTTRALRVAARMISRREPGRVPGIEVWTGLDRLEIAADPPAAVQADGEHLGEMESMVVQRATEPLQVIA